MLSEIVLSYLLEIDSTRRGGWKKDSIWLQAQPGKKPSPSNRAGGLLLGTAMAKE